MKVILIDLFIACLGLSLVAHYVLPDHVASHFGAGGHPDGWMSNGTLTAIMVSTHTLLFVVFLCSSRLLRACPPSIISLPNRDYWLAPERRGHAEDILQRLMMEYGIAMFLFMLLVSGLTLRANLSQPVTSMCVF